MFLTRTRRVEPATDLYSNLTRLNRMMDEALSGWDGEAVGSGQGSGVDAMARTRIR